MSPQEYLDLLSLGETCLRKPHIGLEIARQLKKPKIGILSYLVQQSTSIRDYCQIIERYLPLFMRGINIKTNFAEPTCETSWQVYWPSSPGIRHEVELSIAAFNFLLRQRIDRSWRPLRVNFKHKLVPPFDAYKKIFGAEVYFEQDQNSIVFEANYLDLNTSKGDVTLLRFLRQHAESLLKQQLLKSDLLSQLRLIIIARLEHNKTAAADVAYALNISVRTLHRRLTQFNTNYRAFRESVIMDFAKDALTSTQVQVTELAARLGYSEMSAFSRAFKQSTGQSPLAFRQGNNVGIETT